MIINSQVPTFAEEEVFWKQGCRLVAGIDEVGRGALAGPVAAAAVILPSGFYASWLDEVRDSKELAPAARGYLSERIHEVALGAGIGIVSHKVIDAEGIVWATRLAMKRAIEHLAVKPQSLLIDYMLLPEVSLPQKGVADGDAMCLSIACASIVAKVARDHLMIKLDKLYPGYGLASNKGYGTEGHINCLARLGPCPIHRRSFRPLKDMICQGK